jgi:hypothetical protein
VIELASGVEQPNLRSPEDFPPPDFLGWVPSRTHHSHLAVGWPQIIKDMLNLERARWRLKVRQSAQVVSGTAREEAVGRPPNQGMGTMSTALQDPPARLLNLPSPPPEPVKPPSPLSLDISELLERLDCLRSAAGNSRYAAEPHYGSARGGG